MRCVCAASAVIPRAPVATFVAALALTVVISCGSGTGQERYPPAVQSGPVYYEMFARLWSDSLNGELLHHGMVNLKPLGVFNIADFNWRTHERKDLSFWIRMERNDYLVPLLDRWEERDRYFVDNWIRRWLDVHEADPKPNKGNRDAMGIGQRGMVLTWYLKRLMLERPQEKELIERLENVLAWHEEFLEAPEQFDNNSNHGMWEAMGLFETTRVVPDSQATQLALRRLKTIVDLSVSAQGFHKEHAPAYHFFFHKWLRSFTTYLESLDLGWAGLDTLMLHERKMRRGAYYLQDHYGNVAQIGDTDAAVMSDAQAAENRDDVKEAIFDSEAGYAIFKDRASAQSRRHIIYSVQNDKDPLTMRYHCHNDAMAVFYRDDGEVILGDAGRYTYDKTGVRSFVVSSRAHNTIVPSERMYQKLSVTFADRAWMRRENGQVVFGARDAAVKREVFVPIDGRGVVVADTIRAPGTFTILWNLGRDVERIEPIERGAAWRLHTKRNRLFSLEIRVEGATPAVEIVRGQKKPLLGWTSPAYNVLLPTSVIVVEIDVVAEARIRTEVQPVWR